MHAAIHTCMCECNNIYIIYIYIIIYITIHVYTCIYTHMYMYMCNECFCNVQCSYTFSLCHNCRGDHKMVQRDGVVALLWRDNRVVTVLSTNTQPQQQAVVQRRENDGSRIDVQCPAVMAMYNQYMGGVDKNDQLRQYYHVRLKCRKFYRYLFWFLFEVCAMRCAQQMRISCTMTILGSRKKH